MIILKDVDPPLLEVSKLKGKASQVYGLMWTSARMDVRYDKRKHLPWEERRDCGGTTHWTIKGISGYLNLSRATVSRALSILLDNGFITAENYSNSPNGGSHHTIWRVVHPNQIEHVRHSISIMGLPSIRWKNRMKSSKEDRYQGEIYDTTEKEPFDHWKDDVSIGYSSSYYEYIESLIDSVTTEKHINL